MNKKGQALIEFILIMPVFFVIVMGIFDFGNILYQRNQLEFNMDTVAQLYKDKKIEQLDEYLTNRKLTLSTEEFWGSTTLTIQKKVNIYTPGLSFVLGSPYNIETNKVVLYYE